MADHGYEIQKAEIIYSFTGSRKISTSFLELSKLQFYLALHGIIISAILLYQSAWLFSKTTTAYCYAYRGDSPEDKLMDPGTLVYEYKVDDKIYSSTSTRNEMPLTQHSIAIRYLFFYPDVSRLDNFEGIWAGFIIAWGIFFVITSMIFFIPNDTMPSNSYFYFTKRKPWINMIVK